MHFFCIYHALFFPIREGYGKTLPSACYRRKSIVEHKSHYIHSKKHLFTKWFTKKHQPSKPKPVSHGCKMAVF